MREDIDAVLAALDRKEAQVIRERFGLDGRSSPSFSKLGEQLRLTRERVRQIEKRALGRLRSPSRARLLQYYRTGA